MASTLGNLRIGRYLSLMNAQGGLRNPITSRYQIQSDTDGSCFARTTATIRNHSGHRFNAADPKETS